MPKDPRVAAGTCDSTDPWVGPLQPWQTGGAGAGQIPATFSSSYTWPPTSISGGGAATLLPTYTQTGPIPTLPAPTFTKSSGGTVDAGDGWANTADNSGMAVPIPTCSYLDPWVGSAAPPSPLCTPAAARRNVAPEATITPAP
jgi:glucan 1,3-beta-glucosidase